MKRLLKTLVLLLALFAGTQARAGIPVIDATNLIQNIQQVLAWSQQLSQMANQLNELQQQRAQLQAQFNALNGLRNIGSLLNGDLLNQYLPTDYATALDQLRSGSGALASLRGDLNNIAASRQIRSCTELYADASQQAQCQSDWQQLAMAHKLGDMGYQKASQNIGNLQQYITSITTADDAKSLQDLTARIGVEQIRMSNEQIKLDTAKMMAAADEEMRRRASIEAFSQTIDSGSSGQIQF